MTTKKRIQWIDIAKGISIILVVYGHSGLNNVPIHRFMVTCLSNAVLLLRLGIIVFWSKIRHHCPILTKTSKDIIQTVLPLFCGIDAWHMVA